MIDVLELLAAKPRLEKLAKELIEKHGAGMAAAMLADIVSTDKVLLRALVEAHVDAESGVAAR